MNILIAEDDAEYRNVLCETFTKCGHMVFSAADGIEAFKLLKSVSVDLIISDIQMPNRTGAQLHDLVRDDRSLRHIPFIYVTGFSILRLVTPVGVTGLDFMASKVPFERLLQLVDDIGVQKGTPRSNDVTFASA